jgi:putative Mn2+ efflux pump MntP
MDCFAVAVSFGASSKLKWKDVLRTASFFGFFQGLMPLIGWIIGDKLKEFISSVDHWIAAIILGFIGTKMILQAVRQAEKKVIDIRTFPILFSLSLATSIDALITGITLGFIEANIFVAAIMIMAVTFLNTIIGVKVGEQSCLLQAKWAEIAGGIILIGIGIKILVEHLIL